jgi:VanZ family protein
MNKVINWFKKFIKNPILNWSMVVAYAGIIFLLSSLTASQLKSTVPSVFYFPDYLLHFFQFFILGILLFRALIVTGYKKAALIAVTFCFIFAISDELHQLFVKGRVFSIKDIFADTLGAIAAQLPGLKNLFLK